MFCNRGKQCIGTAAVSPALHNCTMLTWHLQHCAENLESGTLRVVHACRRALDKLRDFAEAIGERVLDTPNNPISIGLTLTSLQQSSVTHPPSAATPRDADEQMRSSSSEPASSGNHGHVKEAASTTEASSGLSGCEAIQTGSVGTAELLCSDSDQHVSKAFDGSSSQKSTALQTASRTKLTTFLGSMLFKRAVSGCRVVARGKEQSVAGHCFTGYGAHCDAYPCDYLTFAAALGTTEEDVNEFLRRLNLCIKEFKKQNCK